MSIWHLVLSALIGLSVVGGFCALFGSIYGVAFRFASPRLAGAQATWSSSLWSGVIGTFFFLSFSSVMMIVVMGIRGAIDPSPISPVFAPYLLAAVHGPAILVQMVVTGRMLRRPDETRFGFKNAAKVVAIPAVLLGVLFALTYRPPMFY